MTRPALSDLLVWPIEDVDDLYRDLASVRELRRQTGTVSCRLAALRVGESTLFENWSRPGQLQTHDKNNARKRLLDEQAQWTARSTTKGVRVTRTR